jgi:small GTP-binding protein
MDIKKMLEINLALVGHTNVGKTSLLRTLSYNSYFGEVSYKASTTRHIEKATLNFDNLNLNFFDTPGLEDASGLLDYLEDMPKTSRNGLERLEAFFATKVAITDFSQEMKVLKQLIQSDLGLYVVDVREPFLNKYYDELVLLRDCAKPLLLIFNFLGEEKYLTIWQEQVKTLGIHKVIYFDAQNPQDGEENLYKALAFMLPQYQKSLDEALNALTLKKYHKISQALFKTSDMLIDCISFKMIIKQDDDLNELKTIIRKRESSNIQDILKAFNFPVNQQLTANHIFNNGRFENDLFSFESLKTFTSRISDAF